MFLKCLFLLLITFNATYAFANNKKNYLTNQTTIDILEKNFTTYKLVGEAKYTYFLLDIYDAKLISETGNIEKNKFALILIYNRDISKKNVVEETIKQIQIQKNLNEQDLKELDTLLNKAFREIKKNDIFVGVKNKNTAIFYFNNEKVLETEDIEFIDLFFNIWLRKNSQNPEFTKTLLGQTN
jgi:predicted negative regulator of RcsB-dependent stress response